jgi:hypothetical protein
MSTEHVTEKDRGFPKRRRSDLGIPDWVKLAATVAATTITMFMWATNTFISRTEMSQHMDQQSKDFGRMAATQEHYADAERSTAVNLGTINSRLTGIETKVELVLDGVVKQGARDVRR